MQTSRRDFFTTVRTEGPILPPGILQRIIEGDSDLKGLSREDYHLPDNEKTNESINRSWNRLLGAWISLKGQLENIPENDPATTPTRERWLLPLFQELGYGRLQGSRAAEIDGRPYPVSHCWKNTPIHLTGFRVSLDRRTSGVAGASRSSPHSLVQEYLNRSREHLWAFVSNGSVLRILRDNLSLTRQAYVEFDLQAMMEGEVYSDFSLLWLLCHQSRVEADKPEECWLEKWSQSGQEQGTRVLEKLREGVETAIETLGKGFLTNSKLQEKLRSGNLSTQDYYRQLLRTVYRLLFLFVAEDRELLLAPNADILNKKRYQNFYSIRRLRVLAGKMRGTAHVDLWNGLLVVFEKLGVSSHQIIKANQVENFMNKLDS